MGNFAQRSGGQIISHELSGSVYQTRYCNLRPERCAILCGLTLQLSTSRISRHFICSPTLLRLPLRFVATNLFTPCCFRTALNEFRERMERLYRSSLRLCIVLLSSDNLIFSCRIYSLSVRGFVFSIRSVCRFLILNVVELRGFNNIFNSTSKLDEYFPLSLNSKGAKSST